MSNMREVVRRTMQARGQRCECIRCREVRSRTIEDGAQRLDNLSYATRASQEHFLSFNTQGGKLAGYARLSLPQEEIDLGIEELRGASLIRELHVYGPALPIGDAAGGRAQHRGLGTQLLAEAEAIARRNGFRHMAVIASVGTREYYAGRGYNREGTYMVKAIR